MTIRLKRRLTSTLLAVITAAAMVNIGTLTAFRVSANSVGPPHSSAESTLKRLAGSLAGGSPASRHANQPVSFEINQGQANHHVRFVLRTGEGTTFITADDTALVLKQARWETNPAGALEGVERATGTADGHLWLSFPRHV